MDDTKPRIIYETTDPYGEGVKRLRFIETSGDGILCERHTLDIMGCASWSAVDLNSSYCSVRAPEIAALVREIDRLTVRGPNE